MLLAFVVQENIVRMEENVASHERLSSCYRQASEWLAAAMDRLDACVDDIVDKALVQARQQTLAVRNLNRCAHISARCGSF